MADVLLTVSGVIAPDLQMQIDAAARPRADYLEMARAFDADLLDYAGARQASGRLGRWLEKIGGPNLLLAWSCFRRRHDYRVIFTDGEQVGLPLAALLRFLGRGRQRTLRHLMIVHILSVSKKMRLIDWLGLHRGIDLFFVYSAWQQRFIRERWPVAPEQVVLTPFMVDAQFFAAAQVTPQPRPMICAVGLEFRDYPTLIQAVDGLDVELVIAAASPWSKRSDSSADQSLPDNVTVRCFSQFDLRQVYADSLFTVMPLYAVNFQAGVTAILEAMAMERAVICSRTPGQTDVIVDEETGLYVPPEDVDALRAAIRRLLADPELAQRMGRAGRARVQSGMSLTHYVRRLNKYVQQAKATGSGLDAHGPVRGKETSAPLSQLMTDEPR